jgi:hypothetical protein
MPIRIMHNVGPNSMSIVNNISIFNDRAAMNSIFSDTGMNNVSCE